MKFVMDPEVLEKYSRDRSLYSITPSSVVFPTRDIDVIRILLYAKESKSPLTVRGGGTGLSGAALGEGIIVDMKYFKDIKEIGENTIVQAGCLLKHLRPKVEAKGFMLPSVPLHGDCAIGGNVNTSSLGPKTLKYGDLGKNLLHVRGFLADGRVLDTKLKVIPEEIIKGLKQVRRKLKKEKKLLSFLMNRPKPAGGYNLLALMEYKIEDAIPQLILGSAGTLLVLSEVELKLPKKKATEDLHVLFFKGETSIQKSLNALLKKGPSSIEYLDEITLPYLGRDFQFPGGETALIVEFEKEANLGTAKNHALYAMKISPQKRKKLWLARQRMLPHLEEKAQHLGLQLPSGLEDLTFHPKDFTKIMKDLRRYEQKQQVSFAVYGHIGIGALHVRPFLNVKKKPHRLDEMATDIFKIVKRYKGTLVGEHNMGICRTRYLPMENKKYFEYMKMIKEVFDPDNILNPLALEPTSPITKHIKV